MQTNSTPACGEDTERIEELRRRIDEVDRAIVTHLVERARLAHAVGVAKGGTAVYRPERERAVINKAVETVQATYAESAELAKEYVVIEEKVEELEPEPEPDPVPVPAAAI